MMLLSPLSKKKLITFHLPSDFFTAENVRAHAVEGVGSYTAGEFVHQVQMLEADNVRKSHATEADHAAKTNLRRACQHFLFFKPEAEFC